MPPDIEIVSLGSWLSMNINLPLTERMFRSPWVRRKSISKNDESRVGV
jgi:hypothetical protein